jgi:hypothetical protein
VVPIYAVCVVAGSLAALGWIALGTISSAFAEKAHLDPETRYGEAGRFVVGGVLGFGLGGMSASFAGWGAIPALLGAIGGTGLLLVAARLLGVEQDEPATGDDLD